MRPSKSRPNSPNARRLANTCRIWSSVLAEALPVLQTAGHSPGYPVVVDELSAQIKDQEYDACRTDPCRLVAATEA
jgi:hypothetical protein